MRRTFHSKHPLIIFEGKRRYLILLPYAGSLRVVSYLSKLIYIVKAVTRLLYDTVQTSRTSLRVVSLLFHVSYF